MAKKNARIKLKPGKLATAATASPEKSGVASPMDLSLIEQITRLMRENDLNAIDVRDGDKRIIVQRGFPSPVGSSAPTPVFSHSIAPAASGSSRDDKSGDKNDAAASDANLVPIKSPMVGTFYSSSSPDAKPFVSVGSTVDDDSDVCVIEAMKVFNNIKAETRGTISKVLVTNGSTVEFGQVLFLVKP